MNILITSGPTRAYIDEIRYISNYSTGELGTYIAKEAVKRKNKVTFVYGKGSMFPEGKNIKLIEIQTVDELIKVLKEKLLKEHYDVVIHCMAVLDYVPAEKVKTKIKSDKKVWNLRLIRTPKIINLIKKINKELVLIGFKLEYGLSKSRLISSAFVLLKKSKADFIVANDYKSIKEGKYVAFIVGKGNLIKGNIKGKKAIAREIILHCVNELTHNNKFHIKTYSHGE